MALSDKDCVELLRGLQELLREYDAQAFGHLAERTPRNLPPPRLLLSYLDQIIEFVREHSRAGGDTALRQLNRSIATQGGGPIERITLILSQTEQQLYERESVDLSRLPDRGEFIEELTTIKRIILSELNLDEERERER